MKTLTMIMVLLGAGLSQGAMARSVSLDVTLTNPLLEAGMSRRVVLKVGLTGAMRDTKAVRPPVNMALVIDKSGSMQGERIQQAREAALAAVNRLRDDDIISIVAFDNNITVLVPATRASNRESIRRGIDQIQAGGTTALFAGVSKGAAEVRKFIDREHINRVILLSDGQANVGPRTPGALGELGASLMKEGIAVTTIGLGLGYNEDLMVRLARESDGNHAFVEHPHDLVAIFDREFGEAMSVIAQDVEIRIDCAEGIRPIRTLGRPAEISGQTVTAVMNQLYGGEQRYVLLEVEVPGRPADETLELAAVTASFRNLDANRRESLQGSASAQVTASREAAEASIDQVVVGEAILQEAAEASTLAVQLRDEGRVDDARQVLQESTERLRRQAQNTALPAPARAQLEAYAVENVQDAEALDSNEWEVQRKRMRESQYRIESQRNR